ncbi:MAG: dihydroorotase [Hahellaceae bacterium]|nr:dihydroorotase [Hahellaceae bacterium]MCP5169314.1 dihydroorotase [Hahellaceae bacterium]
MGELGMKVLIKNGNVFDASRQQLLPSAIGIESGKIGFVGDIPAGFEPDDVIDAQGGIVSPGFIDLYTRLCEPGDEYKGSIATETAAAVRGGFTHVCCPPDTLPVNDTAAVTHLITDLAKRAGNAKVLPIGALTQGLKGEQLSELYTLKEAGCVAVSNGVAPLRNFKVLRRCMEYAATHNVTIFARPEDASLAADGCIHEGQLSARLGLVGIPEIAEVLSVSQWILLAEETGVRLHLSQLSCARALQLVEQARRRGVKLTCDVAIHNLVLTESVVDGFDSRFHVRPPLRTEQDRQALLAGVNEGVIDAICSQHLPHEEAAVNVPFAESSPGIAGVETLLPLVNLLVGRGELILEKALTALTEGPARVLGMTTGSLCKGASADLTIFTQQGETCIDVKTKGTQGVNNPWFGFPLPGQVLATLVDGRLSFRLV